MSPLWVYSRVVFVGVASAVSSEIVSLKCVRKFVSLRGVVIGVPYTLWRWVYPHLMWLQEYRYKLWACVCLIWSGESICCQQCYHWSNYSNSEVLNIHPVIIITESTVLFLCSQKVWSADVITSRSLTHVLSLSLVLRSVLFPSGTRYGTHHL